MEVNFCHLLCHCLIHLYVSWLPVWLCRWFSDCRGPWADMTLRRPRLCHVCPLKTKRVVFSRGKPHCPLTFLTPLWTTRVCAFIGNGGQTDEVLRSMKPSCLAWQRHFNLPRRSPSPGQLQACKKANTGRELHGKGLKEEVPVMNSEISSPACIHFLLRQLWPMIEGDALSSRFKRRPGVFLDSSSL